MKCEFCDNTGWVCEDHGDRPLKADSKRGDACSFGAGKPCPRCNRISRHVNDVPRLPLISIAPIHHPSENQPQ